MAAHAGAVEFVFVYQREPHARQLAFVDVAQPKDLGERCALARRTCDELTLPTGQVWVDGMDDRSRALFGDLPSPAILIDAGGVIRNKLPWAEPAALGPAIVEMLAAAKTAAEPPVAAAAAQGAAQQAPGATAPATVPAGDAWLLATRCASVVAERPQDPQWRSCLDRLLASDSVPVRHWALQRLVARLQQADDAAALLAAQQQLAALRRDHGWLVVGH